MRVSMLVCAVVLLLVPALAGSVEQKIGFVNTGTVFAQYSAAKEAQQAYEKEMEQLNKDVTAKEEEIKALADTLEARKYLFSEERLKEKQLELEKRQQDYLKFRQEAEAKAAKRNDELSQPIVQAITAAAKTTAEKESFDLVLDSAAGIVIYSKPEFDLTDKVLQTLEEAKKSTQ